jgi:hypothetical protein
MNFSPRKAVSLVEVLIAMAMLSTLALPMGMFLIEYARGSSQLGDYYQILNLVEQKLEIAMEMPFNSVPDGESTGIFIENSSGAGLDLRIAEVAKEKVRFKLVVETLPVEFAALRDAFSGQLQRARVEQGMKRLELTAEWGDKGQHNIKLLAYKANL